ncbi:hypothetical protein Btru_022805 [Bulinus truncatus]|nr:hypothetical protein Btru_022805 [Bulinus truncatus]
MKESECIQLCYQDYSDKIISQIKARLQCLNCEQLKILICILSQEVERLERHFSGCSRNNKAHSLDRDHTTSISSNYSKSFCLDKKLREDPIEADTFQGIKSDKTQSPIEKIAANEGLIITQNDVKRQLDILHTKDGLLVYSKSWTHNQMYGTSEKLSMEKIYPVKEIVGNSDQPEQLNEVASNIIDKSVMKNDKILMNMNLSTTISCQAIKKKAPRKLQLTSQQINLRADRHITKLKKQVNESGNALKMSLSSTETICESCDKMFSNKNLFKEHLKAMHNQVKTTILCSYCGKLVLKSRLKNHLEKVHEKPSYSCHICHRGFLKRECLEGHLNKHSNSKPYICEYCGRKYAYSTSLSSHKKMCTKSLLPPHLMQSKSRENKDVSYICEICGITFEGTGGLKDHYNAKHSSRIQTCCHCGKNFHWRPSYNRHVKKCKERTDAERAKIIKLSLISPSKFFTCECGKKYPYRQSFRRHQKNCFKKTQLDSYVMSSNTVEKIPFSDYLN